MPEDVTYADLAALRTRPLQSAAQAWSDYHKQLDGYAERITDEVAGPLVQSGWEGYVAEVALGRSEQIREYFEIRSHITELVAGVYESAYERLEELQQELAATVETAASERMTVRPDGVVEPPAPAEYEWLIDGGAVLSARSQRAAEITEQIAALVARANAIDRQTDEALRQLNPEVNLFGGDWRDVTLEAKELAASYGLFPETIPDGGDPQANAAWWDSLTESEQTMYTMAYPHTIGGLDGIPVETRDQANQLALQGTVSSPTADETAKQRAQDLLDRVEQSEYGPEEQRLHILGYDLTEDGKAVISVGNPDTAEHTAVWVPGVDSTIDNIGGDLTRVRNLQAETGKLAGDPSEAATVMWLGYDTPGQDLSAVRGDHAEAGAPALDGFVDGLRTTDGADDGRIVVIGHSYGSTVVGEAASSGDGLAVDDIVTAGSPGMRVDNVEDLRTDPSHVWAGAAEGDDVSGWMGNFAHDTEPHEEDFGANRFEVDTTGHGDYWDKDTLSLENQATIVVGDYDEVTLEHGEPPA